MNNQTFHGKSIILATPTHHGFHQVIEQELYGVGFDQVHNISFFDSHFHYKSLVERAGSFAKKNLFGNKSFKDELKYARNRERIEAGLAGVTYTDYALFIRPEVYPKDLIARVRDKSGMLVAYQWDGIRRFPKVLDYIPLFDRFFVFDPSDLSVEGTKPVTNFYTESLHLSTGAGTDAVGAYYVGAYNKVRIDELTAIVTALSNLGLPVAVQLVGKKNAHTTSLLPVVQTEITYRENISAARRANILVDVQNTAHNGLSFRVFEALGFEKKLITNNHGITQYDFYHPANIFVWGKDDPARLREFVGASSFKLPEAIRKKYGFSNWISHLLDAP